MKKGHWREVCIHPWTMMRYAYHQGYIFEIYSFQTDAHHAINNLEILDEFLYLPIFGRQVGGGVRSPVERFLLFFAFG